MNKINKKSKIISLGAISAIALAVIPTTVVACGSGYTSTNTTTNTTKQTDIVNFISSFTNKKLSISAFNTNIFSSKIPSSLTSTNISTYFSNIPATPSGVTLVYTTSSSNDTTGTISLSVSASEEGLITQTATIEVGGFLTINQNAINDFINTFNSNSTITGISTLTTQNIPATINATNIDTYFTNIPSTPSGSTVSSPITLSFTTSNNNNNLGLIDLSVSASAENAQTLSSIPLTIKGFISTFNQNKSILDGVVEKLKILDLSAPSTKTITQASEIYTSLNANSPLTITELTTYFNTQAIISAVGTTGVILSYSLVPQTTTLNSNGQIELKINASLGIEQGLVNSNIYLKVNGFASVTITENQKTNLTKLDSLITILNVLPLNANTTSNTITPTTIYSNLETNAFLSLSDLNTYFNTSTINAALSSLSMDITATYKIIQPTTTNSQNGSLNILVFLSLGSGDSLVTTSTTLTINGFLNSIQNSINTYLSAINTSAIIRGNNQFLPTTLPTTSTTSSQYLINIPALTSDQISLSYTFSNPLDQSGDASVVISISAPGGVTQTTKAITIAGFLNTNQANVNQYIATINANSLLITGNNTQLPSELSNSTIGTYLNGLPKNNNLIITYDINSVSNVNGSVNLNIIVSAINAIAQTSNSITVNGFKFQSIQSLASTITASDFSTNQASSGYTPPANGTFLSLPIWILGTYSSSTDLIAGIPLNSIQSYIISDLNTVFGYAYMTILFNNGVSRKILLNNIGSRVFYNNSVSTSAVNFSSANFAIAPSTFNKIDVTSTSSADLIKMFSNIGLNFTGNNANILSYVSAYQLNVVSTDTTSGNKTLSITLYFTNPATNEITNSIYIISGSFLPSNTNPLSVLNISLAPGSVYSNYWSSSTDIPTSLGTSTTTNSLYIPTPDSATSFEFKSNATIPTSGIILPLILANNINWPTGYSDASVVSWTEEGNNTTGIATYKLILNDNKTVTLAVSGFMTNVKATTLTKVGAIKLSNISSIATPPNGIVTNTAAGFNRIGISSNINWNNLNDNLFGGGIYTYSIINSDPAKGTVNFLFTFKNGVILSTQITGYSTSSLAQMTVNVKGININAPSNGTLTLEQAKTYFDFMTLTPQFETTFSTIVISDSTGNGSVDLTITTSEGESRNFIVSGFINVVSNINTIQSLVSFQNNTASLIPIQSAFPNNQNLKISATDILNNTNIPNWIVFSEQIKTLINQLISSGIETNTIFITFIPNYLTFPFPSYRTVTNATNAVLSVSAGGISNNVNYGQVRKYVGTLFQSAQQYINNVASLSLNSNILNKITKNDFIKEISSPDNNFVGSILPDGKFNGGFQGSAYNNATTNYSKTQFATILSFFNIGMKTNPFNWNLNFPSSNENIRQFALINVIAQVKSNGILVRIYFGWNAYVETLISNNEFIVPNASQIITNNVAEVISNAIINNQSLNVFKENGDKAIIFNLDNIPSWIDISQNQINSVLNSSGYTAQNINIIINLPTYSYIRSAGTDSQTSILITVSINGVENSSVSTISNNFESAQDFFQSIVTITPSIESAKLTLDQFITQNNGNFSGSKNLTILQKLFNINIPTTWFSTQTPTNPSWSIGNITYFAVNKTSNGINVIIYIGSNLAATINIPASSFAPVTLTS